MKRTDVRIHQRHKARALTRQKFPDPFYKTNKAWEISIPTLIPGPGEFPMSPAIKTCQIKYDTGEGARAQPRQYSNHLSSLSGPPL